MTISHPVPPPDYSWWYARNDDSPFSDGGPTRDGAIAEAIAQDCFQELEPDEKGDPTKAGLYLMRARQRYVDLSQFFDAEDWIERVADLADDEYGPGEDGHGFWVDEITKDDVRDLEACIRNAIWHWQHRRGKALQSYWLDGGPKEWVTVTMGYGHGDGE